MVDLLQRLNKNNKVWIMYNMPRKADFVAPKPEGTPKNIKINASWA